MRKILLTFVLFVLLFSFVSCGGNDKKQEDGNTPSLDGGEKDDANEKNEEGIINLLDYTIVYDQYVLGMEDLAEAFSEKIYDECGTELSILEAEKAKKEKLRIFIGKISNNSDSSKETKRLSELTGKISSAYSIKFCENTLMISGTAKRDVERALHYLSSLIEDGDFKIEEDFSKTEFAFSDSSGEIFFTEDEFKASPGIASITVGGKTLDGFSILKQEYIFEYPASENYPLVEIKTLNPNANCEILLPENNGGVAKITVTAENGKNKMDYEITFNYQENAQISAEVVNKDGKGGVITFVFDDGDLRSADIIISKLMKKYSSIRPSFAIICNQLAKAEKKEEGFKLTPEAYSYIPILNSQFSKTNYKYEFWKRAAEIDGVDVLSHSYSHSNEGVEQDPVFELKASQAILSELCSSQALFYVMPGVGTVNNPNYINTLDSGAVYFGARSTGKKINSVQSYNPYRVSAYAVTRHSTKQLEDGTYTTDENSSRALCLKAGVETWKNHINDALTNGGWACFCFHSLAPAGTDTNGKWTVFEEQVDEIFKYADALSKSNNAWVANFTEASIYYMEWKEAKISASLFGENSVSVKLDCPLDSSVFNMPLTVKVPVPKSWTYAKLGDRELSVMENDDGTKFVYINVAPGETVTITK